jgi:integrase
VLNHAILRHAHASLWLMAGGSLANVQRNLGHSTPVLTSETYRHIAEIIVSARLTDVSHCSVEKRRA